MSLLVLAALYVLAPGHPSLPFAGIPIGQSGIVVLTALALIAAVMWRRSVPMAASVTLAALIAVKLMAWGLAPEPGWLAHYYANATFEGAVERSIDYRSLGATRIDRTLAFADTSFPVHFFNDRRFDRGFRRESTEPFSVRWTGHLQSDTDRTVQVVVRARGQAMLLLDGREIAWGEDAASVVTLPTTTLQLSAGSHVLEVRYSKPSDTEGLFELRGATEDDDDVLRRVLPPAGLEQRASVANTLLVLAAVAHLLALAVLVWVCAPLLAAWARDVRTDLRRDSASGLLRLAAPAIVIALTAQGLWKSRHLVGHVWTLTGGDDWMTFEHNAREVVLNGILMTEGAPPGRGIAYFAYPGYTYFTALVHAVSGESLAGVILMNFVMLAVSAVFILRLSRLLVPAPAALLAVAWLLLLQQADFVRYYTVTLLSENLFVATSAGAVLGFTQYVLHARLRHAATAGIWGGLSSVTRPSMMLFLPCALAASAAADVRRRHAARGLLAAAVAVFAWMAVIAPVTLRNYVVSGEPVLISSGQAKSFIDYNMPPENQHFYLDMYDGSLTSAGIVLARMLVDQPRAFLGMVGHKLGFSLGMVHWAEGVSPHPELLITSALYLASLFFVPSARSLAALPLHFFVFTHLLAVTLSLPWNYGYRMILPMYPLMCVFAMATPLRMFRAVRFEHARAT